MTMVYAAVKWEVGVGPNERDLANDLEILALTLVEEWKWQGETVAEMFERAAEEAREAEYANEPPGVEE